MDVLVQPPQRVRPEAKLEPPPVVRIQSSLGVAAIAGSSSNRVSVVLSIMDKSGHTALAPGREDLVTGNRSGTVHFTDDMADDGDHPSGLAAGQDHALVAFPGIAIRHPGQYRLRVSLVSFCGNGSASGTSGPLRVALSDVITVNS